jgi:hypothetical protein
VPDLDRHRNSVQLKTQFWCTVAGCSRSETFLGHKRPFPRKDKLNSHVKTVHKAAIVSPTKSSNHLGTGSPAAGELDWLDGFNSFTGIGGSTGVDGFASVGRLTSVSGFDNAHGFASVDGLPNIGGLNTIGGFPFVSGSTMPMDSLTRTS